MFDAYNERLSAYSKAPFNSDHYTFADWRYITVIKMYAQDRLQAYIHLQTH